MNPTPRPPDVYDSATASKDELAAPVLWHAVVTIEREPHILSRLLQKLVCQGAVIRSLHYDARLGETSAEVAITFHGVPARAQRLAKQWRTLISVLSVTLNGPK